MEKLRSLDLARTIIKDRRTRLAASFLVAGTVLTATAPAEGRDPSIFVPTAREEFYPLVLDYNQPKSDDLTITIPSPVASPTSSPVASEKPLSHKEQQTQKVKDEANAIYKFAKNSDKFNNNILADLHGNLPFYLAAHKKYPKVSWIVLFVTQEKESGGSDPNSRAFDKSRASSRVQGSYQIDIGWSNDFRQHAFNGLEYTKAFHERHRGDREDTATAALMLDRNIRKQMSEGKSYEQALFKAVALYCGQGEPKVRIKGGDDEVNKRLDMIDKYNKIFAPFLK